MELTGKIKVLNQTQIIGNNGFQKREVVIATEEQYSQKILVEFIKDQCDMLDAYAVGQLVKIDINLKGREWINPEGVPKYFNSIQGWRIQSLDSPKAAKETTVEHQGLSFIEIPGDDDLPF
ncbi:DUF3127 domain-containing protein [Zunongwangia pacifica]|uniref:DUF3127 domain-containing protein n=1 Tax=Zunongwangia pacifica TaxID=2911062 RepID=A0A9X2CPS6_9FLAO|nr:DUF3127 domain-containing protein [Zunongwangia pacifica]MCL6218583.1 DUF3127 domain-containing protein [Zunongwangia pacifica]